MSERSKRSRDVGLRGLERLKAHIVGEAAEALRVEVEQQLLYGDAGARLVERFVWVDGRLTRAPSEVPHEQR